MLNRVTAMCIFLVLPLTSCQGRCSSYFKYFQTSDDTQGKVELPVEMKNPEHRIQIKLSVASQLTSVNNVLIYINVAIK